MLFWTTTAHLPASASPTREVDLKPTFLRFSDVFCATGTPATVYLDLDENTQRPRTSDLEQLEAVASLVVPCLFAVFGTIAAIAALS